MYLNNSALHNFVRIAYLVLAFVEFGNGLAKSTTSSTTPDCIYDVIPQAIPTECTTLTIRNSNLGVLSSTAFSHLNASNIQTLIISNNRITNIGRNAMESFPALQHLDASDNLMRRLDSGVLQSLYKLTNLYLQRNKISTISNSAFDGLENLQVLRLDNNQLRSIDFSLLDVPNLETLNLTTNQITEIPSNAFDGLTKLHYLFLAYNRLTEMPEALKDGNLKKLHILNLRSNLINTTLTSSHLHYDYLEELYLTTNDIPALSDDVFKYLRRLRMLHLDHNRLTNFDAWSRQHPQNLQEIKLGNNEWECNCNDIEVWDLLDNQQNLTIVERDSTLCVTPSYRRGEVAFEFASSCNSEPVLTMAELIGIIAACAIIFTGTLTICICCYRKHYEQSCRMTVNPAKSHHTDSRVELHEPNHEYLSHATSPKNVPPTIPNGPISNGKLVAGDSSTLKSHIYDLPEFREALCRDPSYINNKVLRMNLQRTGIDLKQIPDCKDKDSDENAEYYLVPIDMVKTNRSRNDSDDGIVI